MRRILIKHRYQLSWRYLFEKKARNFLTFIGVVVGVATIFAVAVTNETTIQSFQEMINDVTGRADLEVVSVGDEGLAESLTAQLRALPEIGRAVPTVSKQGVLITGEARTIMLVLGVDPVLDAEMRRYSLAEGRMVEGGHEVVLVGDTAAAAGLRAGDEATLLTMGGPVKLKVAGLLKKEGPAQYQNGAVAFIPISLAQQLFDMDGRVSTIQLTVKEGSSADAARDAIRSVLPSSATVQFPASRGKSAAQWLSGTTSGISYISYSSILLGSFIIFNTFSMTVAERRREISILRALGATKRQIMGLILLEALLIGSLGALAGLAFGLLLAKVFIVVMAQITGTAMGAPLIPWSGVLTSLAVGIGFSLASTYLPARRATAISPLEGMRPLVSRGERAGMRWAAVGLALAALGWILFVGYLFSSTIPEAAGMIGIIIFLLGAVVALPTFYAPLIRLAGVVLRRLLGTEAVFAQRNLLRTETRNALTAGVLMMAIAVAVGVGHATQSGMDLAYRWLNSTVVADFFVRGALLNPGATVTVQIAEGQQRDLEQIPGVAGVDKLRFLKAEGPDGELIVMAESFDGSPRLPLTLEKGDEDAVRSSLRRGEIVVSTNLAQKYHLDIGSEFPLETKSGRKAFRVAGINTEFTNNGNALYMEWKTAQKELGLSGVDAFLIEAAPDADLKAVERDLSRFAASNGLILQSSRELHDYIAGVTSDMMSFYWMIGLIAMAVASLGIINTLTTNVLDRWREIAILRAVAATKRQVRRLIVVEAAYLGLVSVLTGWGLGLISEFMFLVQQNRMAGYTLVFSWHWQVLLGVAVLSTVSALLASILPARRATGMNIAAAIKHE